MRKTLSQNKKLIDRIDRQARLMEKFDSDEYAKLSRLQGMILADFPCDWTDELEPGCTVVVCENEDFSILKQKELKFLEMIAKETYGDDIISERYKAYDRRTDTGYGRFYPANWKMGTSPLRAWVQDNNT